VTAGTIRVDGVDVRDWDVNALRRQLGIVFQDPFLFSNTIENNVRFGRHESQRDVIRQAIDDAAALEFVDVAPDGLDTLIGERGLTLSGGERQRLTLARAILIDPKVLLLDDAMSAVDAHTEVKINTRLDDIMRGRTTLVVSHRLGTWRHADRILVIAGGRLVAQGTHDELMKTNDYYRQSAMLQIGREHEDGLVASGAQINESPEAGDQT
jgi:ATP-binding cassette subfamily B protein